VFDSIMDGDTGALSRLKPVRPELRRALAALLDPKGNTPGFLQNCQALFQRDLPQLEPHIDDLIKVVSRLDTLGYQYRIDVTTGAGFEYYTGMAFKLFSNGEQIGGGGRYDALMPLVGGNQLPASGFALYLDRLMDRLAPSTVTTTANRMLVSLKSDDGATLRQGFAVADRLREAGFAAELDLGPAVTGEYKWRLVVGETAPIFVLTDELGREKAEFDTPNDVITWLEGKSADKAGAA
jgi:histidyl-tRNA synthetase